MSTEPPSPPRTPAEPGSSGTGGAAAGAEPLPEEVLWSWVDREAPELERHLARVPADRERVEALRATLRGVARATGRLPERVGPYRVLGLLGEGGMGVVYEALQPEPRRRVAVKVVRPARAADPELQARFRREAAALARLAHPSIATIHEAGTTGTGEPWLAMELVRGRPLDRWVAEERPPRAARVELLRRIAEAVEHAHRHGVVHRDLKPSNVLVTADGAPKVLDFGLARLAGDELGVSLATHTGGVLGTLPFMSPEQVRGDGARVDERTDVYALGVLLYTLLCDRPPLELGSTSLPEAARRICEVPPRRLRRVDRLLRGDLETITLKALEKDPARRYASAAALAEDLRRYQDGEPIQAVPPSLGYRLRKLAWRHKAATAAGTMILFLLAWIGLRPSVDWFAGLTGDGFPVRSPFEDVRWVHVADHRAATPLVQVEGRWYELLAIDDLSAGLLVEYCRQTAGASYMKRFSEDLVQVLHRLGDRALFAVDLRLLDRETGEVVELADVALDGAKRRRIYDRRYRAPWDDAWWEGTELHATIDGRRVEVLALGGVPAERWRARAFSTRPEVAAREGALFDAPFLEVATRVLGETPIDTVSAELRDLETDAVVHVPALPIDHDEAAEGVLAGALVEALRRAGYAGEVPALRR